MGFQFLGEGVLSTLEIPVEEIVSSGTDRIIVYEGAEDKLNQLSSGLLEKLGVGGSSGRTEKIIGIQLILYQSKINYYLAQRVKNKII